MFTFSSFVSSPVFSWKHHLPLEDAHRTLHISLLSIMTNRKSITGTKPSKYKQMTEKYRKKELQISELWKNPNNLQMWVGEGGLSVTRSTISPFRTLKCVAFQVSNQNIVQGSRIVLAVLNKLWKNCLSHHHFYLLLWASIRMAQQSPCMFENCQELFIPIH